MEILVIEFYDHVIMAKSVASLSIYRSPQFTIKEFYSELDQVMSKTYHFWHLIFTRDFNIDLFARSPERDIMIEYTKRTKVFAHTKFIT